MAMSAPPDTFITSVIKTLTPTASTLARRGASACGFDAEVRWEQVAGHVELAMESEEMRRAAARWKPKYKP
uniref:Uncharacterized protein n=1 Tax=Oryza glumipatula TaxID=40148 RepID=A0A0E0ARA9_9ORYZ